MNIDELKYKHSKAMPIFGYSDQVKAHTEASIDYAISVLESIDEMELNLDMAIIIENKITELQTLKNQL